MFRVPKQPCYLASCSSRYSCSSLCSWILIPNSSVSFSKASSLLSGLSAIHPPFVCCEFFVSGLLVSLHFTNSLLHYLDSAMSLDISAIFPTHQFLLLDSAAFIYHFHIHLFESSHPHSSVFCHYCIWFPSV